MIPPRFIIIGALAALVGLLLWRGKYLENKLARSKQETAESNYQRDLAREQVTAEQEARAHEQAIAKQASNQFQSAVTALQDELAARPLGGPVRLCKRASVPEASGATGAASGHHGPPEANDDQANAGDHQAGPDIEQDLAQFAFECEINKSQVESLQSWIRSR